MTLFDPRKSTLKHHALLLEYSYNRRIVLFVKANTEVFLDVFWGGLWAN